MNKFTPQAQTARHNAIAQNTQTTDSGSYKVTDLRRRLEQWQLASEKMREASLERTLEILVCTKQLNPEVFGE